jgi:hypothetical protein
VVGHPLGETAVNASSPPARSADRVKVQVVGFPSSPPPQLAPPADCDKDGCSVGAVGDAVEPGCGKGEERPAHAHRAVAWHGRLLLQPF